MADPITIKAQQLSKCYRVFSSPRARLVWTDDGSGRQPRLELQQRVAQRAQPHRSVGAHLGLRARDRLGQPAARRDHVEQLERAPRDLERLGVGPDAIAELAHQPLRLAVALPFRHAQAVAELDHALVGPRAWLQVARGRLRLGDVELASGDGAGITRASTVILEAREPTEVVLFDLP